jgi:pimeloyl-ACP methyl ester carboxylesterase
MTPVRVRGLEFNVVDSGGDGGLPFLWAHPLTSSVAAEDRHRVFDWSASCGGRRWIRYDARGHGSSTATRHAADYRWANLAHDQLELLDALEVDRVVLGGASMGAATALHAAAAQPDRVDALVLAIPPAGWDARQPVAKRYRSGARHVLAQGVHWFEHATRRMPDPPIFDGPLAPLRGGGLGTFDSFHRLALAAALRGAAGSDLPTERQLAALRRIPAVVLAWDTDPSHPVSTALQLAASFDHADVHVAAHPDDVLSWPDHVAHFLADCG